MAARAQSNGITKKIRKERRNK